VDQGRVTGIVTRRRLGVRGIAGRIPARATKFLPLPTASRPTLGPTRLPIQLLQTDLSPGTKLPAREAHRSLHLLPRLKISGLYFHSPIHVNVMYRDNFTYTSTRCVRVFLYYLRHKTSAYANLDFFVSCVFLCLSKLRDFRLAPRCEICALLHCHTA
jgi:hypothetical protein